MCVFGCMLLLATQARADDADDLAAIAHMDARLHADVAPTLRVFNAQLGQSVSVLLRERGLADNQVHQVWLRSGSNWVEKKLTSYYDSSCANAGLALSAFSLEAGMRAYFQAREIARELDAGTLSSSDMIFSLEGARCEPGWSVTANLDKDRFVDMRFAADAALTRVKELGGGNDKTLDADALGALDARTRTALPMARVEAEALSAEAEIVETSGEEFLVASIGGKAYVCANDDIHFVYDYYQVQLRCEGDATPNALMTTVYGVEPGKSEHRMLESMASTELLWRDGLVTYQSDDELLDSRVWIDALSNELIEGRFEGTVTTGQGKRVKITGGRFRLLPGADFRVTQP